jgi:hypothetical protein
MICFAARRLWAKRDAWALMMSTRFPDHSLAGTGVQSAATATAPVGAGRRTRKHSGIIATQSHAEK